MLSPASINSYSLNKYQSIARNLVTYKKKLAKVCQLLLTVIPGIIVIL